MTFNTACALSAIVLSSVASAADLTVEKDLHLTADMTVERLTVKEGVTLNLNEYKLTCSSLDGAGTITGGMVSTGDLTSPQGVVSGTYLVNGVDTELQGGSYAALFDDNFDNYSNPNRLLSGTLKNGNFLTVVYDFGEGRGTAVNKFKIYNGSFSSERNPYVWRFEGSNDNSVWTTLHSVGEYTPNETGDWSYVGSISKAWKGDTGKKTSVEYSFENETAYRYYRFVFIKTNASYCELKQLEFFHETRSDRPGELHVNVAEGTEMENTGVSISGNVKVVKEGLGVFKPKKTNQTYTGGTEILAGTIVAVAGGAGYSGSPLLFGPAGSKIIVSKNETSVGAFDVNGQTRYGGYDFILNGGIVKNSQPLAVNHGKLVNVTLSADSAFDFECEGEHWSGFYNPESPYSSTLDLGGFTLSVLGGTYVNVENLKVVSQGRILIESGLLQFYGRYASYINDFTKAVLEISADAQMVFQNPAQKGIMSVKLGDYICNTAGADSDHDGVNYTKVTPKLYGTFKPNTDYFHGVELQDGATIDLSGRTGTLPLRGLRYPNSDAKCLHTITFATPVEPSEEIAIYVKLGERNVQSRLISWDEIPQGVKFISAPGEPARVFRIRDGGLFLSKGFCISVH